jgi:hypothetical protein
VTGFGLMSGPAREDPCALFLRRSGWLDREWAAAQTLIEVEAESDPVTHYLEHGAPAGLAPNPHIAELQNPSERTSHEARELRPPAAPADDDPQLLLEEALIRDSGLFDARFYALQHAELIPRGVDPLHHFCRLGWRLVLRPNPSFDTWWYWVNHLDPGHEAINPLVHYALIGRAAGLPTLPEDVKPRIAALPPPDRPMMRRVCLMAGYDADGILDDYVVDYARELSRHADVYYLCDGYLDPSELAKLDGIAAGAWAIRHGAYDFGSYSMLARDLVGWDRIGGYDELLLVNDSCYLLTTLDRVFAQMEQRDCAWWGLQATKGLTITQNHGGHTLTRPVPLDEVKSDFLPDFEGDPVYDFHIGSYFLAYRKPVISDTRFRRVLDSVHKQRSKLQIVLRYEIGITHYLIGAGFEFDTFIPSLYPFHPLFTEWYFDLLGEGFPLLKKYLLYQNHYDVPDLQAWKERILSVHPDAPVTRFEQNLLRISPADKLDRSFAIITRPDGSIHVPTTLTGRDLRAADRRTPTFPHWWAFVVDPYLNVLPDNSRAIFEAVRDDPSVKKVILSRARRIELPGQNVVTVALDSPEGQYYLLRSGQVLVELSHRIALKRRPLDWGEHGLVLVRGGLPLQKLGTALLNPDRGTDAPRVTENPRHQVRGFLTSSDLDQLAGLTTAYPATYDVCWRTGLPAHDFIVMPEERLPQDLAADLARLRDQVGERRLMLFAPGTQRSMDRTAYRFSDDEVGRLTAWARRHDTVIGLREDPHDRERAYLRQLAPHVLDLSIQVQPHLSVVLRASDALLTDVSGVALDFLATGRPVRSFVHDLDEIADDLFFDLCHVMPSPVARTFDELMVSLGGLFDEPAGAERRRYVEVRRLFFDHVDGMNAHRAARQIRATYVDGAVR